MAKKITGTQALTGNRLSDGGVVFLASNGVWRAGLENARLAHSDEDIADLEAEGADAVEANRIVDPYLVGIEVRQGRLVPAAFREHMRTRGPSVNLDFNSRTNGQAASAA